MNICSILMNGEFMDILTKIVDSDSKTKLLVKLLERPSASFSVSGLGRLADLPKASVSNIVAEWEKTGLVLSTQEGRNKMVYINTNFYLLPELEKIFQKTRDFQRPLVEEIKKMPNLKKKLVKAVVVFGSRTRNDFAHSSDIDVLVVLEDKNNEVSEKIVEEFVQASEKTGIRFSPVIMDKKDFKNRWKEKDKFLQNILTEGKILKGGKWVEHIRTSR